MQILFLTTLHPGARRSGSEIASAAFVEALRDQGHAVRAIAYRRAGSDPPLTADDVAVADRHIETRSAGARPALWMARAVLSRRAYSVAKYVSAAFRRSVAAELRDRPPALVVVDHAQLGWLVPRNGWAVPHVYLAHNVEHRLYAQLAAAGGRRRWANAREASLIRGTEEALCRSAREVWTLTAEDADALHALGHHARVRSFDLPPSPSPAPPSTCRRDIAVLGTWTWDANAAGLRWLVDRACPHLPAGVNVDVGGAGADEIVAGIERVRACGRVPDAMEFLQSARVVAVPAVAGAGVQVKTLEAIASGRPVVATPTALRGIADEPPTVRIEEDPKRFGAALGEAVAGAPDPAVARTAKGWAHARRRRFNAQLAEAIG